MPQQEDPKDPNKKPTPQRPQGMINLLVVMFLITFVLNILSLLMTNGRYIEITYDQFRSLVGAGFVKTAQINETEILIQLKKDADKEAVYGILQKDEGEAADQNLEQRQKDRIFDQIDRQQVFATGKVDDPQLTQILTDGGVTFMTPIPNQSPILSFVSQWILPLVVMYVLYYLLMRSLRNRMGDMGGLGGMMNVGKSKAKLYSIQEKTGVTFSDVAGQDEAKESLMEMVDYLNNPDKYKSIGAKQPKGALLVGPPGTGKTLLARAVAGEAGVPFFSLSGSEFVEMYVGVGASRVRDLFEQAKKNAPCIIFIDEIDAIGKSRDGQIMGGNDEREQTLNQLLAEMDGFDATQAVVILAATNRPDVLDKALLRPGRFDRRVIVEKPDLPGRVGILQVHAAKVRLGADVNLSAIALATSGATGADLANIVNEAALRAVRLNRNEVTQEDLMESVELIIAGKEKKDRILNPKEKRMVAYHEVGHALVAALQKDSPPVQKITIVPRTMGALGYTMQTPEEERYLMTRDELMDEITKLLGGRTAEEIVFNQASTGASNDIERATKIARSMVTQYGMSEAFDLMGLESTQNQYLDGRNVLTCSDATGKAIDEEALKILRECHERARALLAAHREKLDEIAGHLLEKETISGATFMEILKK